MEVEEIQASNKFPRIGNGSSRDHKPSPEDDDNQDPSCLELKRDAAADAGNRLRGWHTSRIIRVSRASGGKDRHSKVWTSKGLRDRRVRLSVTTAIQFYDLQDRLNYDQPSKAIEWLIKAAADAIAELPSLNNSSFPDTPKQLSDEKKASCERGGFDSAEIEFDQNYNQNQNQTGNQSQHLSLSKSACSSTSETSKGSGLSLSRSEVRVNRSKARERARERAAKDKDKESIESAYEHNINNNISQQNASFTELLTAGIGTAHNNNDSPTASAHHHQQNHGGGGGAMDYFHPGLLGLSSSARTHQSAGFSGQIHLGMNSIPQTMSVVSPFNVSGEHHHGHHSSELQHFSFVPDLIPVTTSTEPGNGGDYNLNVSISSSGSLAGFNRGTLQSNSSSSPSLVPHHLQRFSPIDGSSNLPFFIGAAAAAAAPTMENHHHHHHHHQQHQQQFPGGFDRRLQQLYGDGTRHSDHKGKAKN